MGIGWRGFVEQAPELAAFARGRFEATGLGLLATLRRDGSPRISALEVRFVDDEVWLAMMPGSAKGRDLRRDGRFALHNATVDTEVVDGDVKVSGLAVPAGDGAPDFGPGAEVCAAEVAEVATVRVDHERARLVIEHWRPGQGVRRVERD